MMAKLGRWLVNGTFMCNGDELANIYRSPQTLTVVSSALNEDEFFEREDTCQADKIRILFIGFIRPEKGVEYLIEAVSELRKKRPWELILVGSGDQFSIYGKKLDSIIARKGIGERVRRIGYVPYGTKMFSYLRDADIFVLPSLSEGTPRVLVEARANSLPVVATNVGGIPTSVTDGRDGLLVPPKDPQALSRAIERIIDNGELRRSLIKNGLHSAHKMTIGRFVDLVVNVMEDKT
jgi:glycosyltransferase involved in cell wall biosynthesis